MARRIEELEKNEQDRLRLLDLWIFQKREIEEAKLQAGEDELLETEKRVLANAKKSTVLPCRPSICSTRSGSTSGSLSCSAKTLEELCRFEPKFQEALAALSARISVEDVGASLRDYAGGIEASPEHLAEVEDRLALLDRLKRKYGLTLTMSFVTEKKSPRNYRRWKTKTKPAPFAWGTIQGRRTISEIGPSHLQKTLRSSPKTGKGG